MAPIADLQQGMYSVTNLIYRQDNGKKKSDEYIMIPDRLIPQNMNSVEGVCIVILKGGRAT